MPNLKCDSAISSTVKASASAAAIAGPRQHEQQKAIHEHPRQQRQRDRKRSVFGGKQDSQRRKMQRGDHADAEA